MPLIFQTAADGLSGKMGLSSGEGIGFDTAGLQDGVNLLINAAGEVNQRGYTSGAATAGANQFTVDRWFVPTTGQALTWTEATDANYRIFNAPASGMVQVIEASKIQTGKYVANWVGTGTLFVNGVQRFKGVAFDLTYNAATNVVVKFVGQVSKMRLERGLVPTRFSSVDLDVAKQAADCERYYGLAMVRNVAFSYGSGEIFTIQISFPTKRAVPTVVIKDYLPATNVFSETVAAITTGAANIQYAAAAIGATDYFRNYAVNAELTS